jgi:membrane protease YdiL (CAAX protease family)
MALGNERLYAAIDVASVVGVSALYVTLECLHVPKRWSYAAVAVLLVVFGAYLARRGHDSWQALGFRTDNLPAASRAVGLFTLAAAAVVVGWALLHGRVARGAEVVVLLFVYPIWAIIQQCAFQGVLHRKLAMLVPSRTLQTLITAISFAAVHFGNPALVALTFVAGLCWSLLYRRYPNVWALAASHTVLAALAYPILLHDAPLSRI